jgi:hypothetical protein
MNSKGMSQVAFGILLAGALAFPVRSEPITYGFDDGTLQGWTTVSSDPGNSPDPERYSSGIPSGQDGGGQGGTTYGVVGTPWGGRDNAHKPLWVRSPQFKIDQSGDVALRDVATGDFVLTGQRITSAGGANWIQIAWDVSAYRNNGKHYTLELFDYHSGNGYSQLAMDSVSIPGTLVSDLPKGTIIRLY